MFCWYIFNIIIRWEKVAQFYNTSLSLWQISDMQMCIITNWFKNEPKSLKFKKLISFVHENMIIDKHKIGIKWFQFGAKRIQYCRSESLTIRLRCCHLFFYFSLIVGNAVRAYWDTNGSFSMLSLLVFDLLDPFLLSSISIITKINMLHSMWTSSWTTTWKPLLRVHMWFWLKQMKCGRFAF